MSRGKAWGVRMDLRRRTVSSPAVPMPDMLMRLAERMRGLHGAPHALRLFHPNEANALDYRRGVHELSPHVDDRWLGHVAGRQWGGFLGARCCMLV